MIASIWRKTAAIGMVVAIMVMAIPLMDLNAAADEEDYWFYVDLTPDYELNGEWIQGTGPTPAEAFINAVNARYGAENNDIDPSGWITKVDGLATEGVWGGTWEYFNWAHFGYVDGVFDLDAHLMGGAKPTTNNQYAIFRTQYVWVEIISYEGASTLTEAEVLGTAEYGDAATWPQVMGPVPDGYTPKAVSATYDGTEWNVVWYILPNAQLNHVDEYAKLTVPAYGYAQRDEAAGLEPYVPGISTDFITDVTRGYAPLTVQFTDRTLDAGDWQWDFGDGTSSTDQDPSHTYSTPGRYTITLTTTNAGGNHNASRTVTVEQATEPGAPTNLAAAAGDSQVVLTWNAPANDGGASISHYVVYKDGVSIGTYTGTSAAITELTNGNQYKFTVAAVNSVGESERSNEATATPNDDVEGFTPDTEFQVTATSDVNGRLSVTYDPTVLRFMSATGATSIVNTEGAAHITTAGANGPVEVKFAVVENAPIGLTTVTLNGESKVFNIVPGEPAIYSSFVIVEQDEARNIANVSLYKVSQIAGFKLVFHYDSGTPVMNDLAGLGSRGSVSTAVDEAGKTITVVWASSDNVNLKGILFSISGASGLALSPAEADLRHITDDLSVSVRVDVGVASSYEDAVARDPNPSTDLNNDGATDLADLILLMQHLAGYEVSIDGDNADLDGDGVVDIRDAIVLQDLITVA